MVILKNEPKWSIREPARFLITGVISSTSSLATIFILVEGLGLWPVWGTIFANLVSGLIGFVINKIWTFHNLLPCWLKQAFFYFSLVGLNLIISAIVMYILNDVFHIWYLLDQAIILLSMAIFNYLINKNLIFSEPS